MAIAQGDIPILWLLFEYHILTTSQLKRLLKRSRQVLLRRARTLRKEGYIRAMDSEMMADNCYCLAKKGWQFIAVEMNTTVEKLPFSKGVVRMQAIYRKHALLTNSVRIALTESAKQHDEIVLHRYIAEWEQVENPRRKSKNRKYENYLLWERLEDEKQHIVHDHRPDGIILVGRKSDPPDIYAGLFIEADRGTEDIARKIRAKFKAYKLFYDQKLYYKKFGASVMRVLFVLGDIKTERRIRNMQIMLQKMAHQLNDPNPQNNSPASFVHCFRFIRYEQLSDETAWTDKLWQDFEGKKYSLFTAPEARKSEAINEHRIDNYMENTGA